LPVADAQFPPAFEREMGCTVADLRDQLPGASRGARIGWHADGADVALEGGALALRWQVLSPRRIGLVTLPRLAVRFQFDPRINDEQRAHFMRYFDLYTQRGGG
jgi:hypothetical protein